METGYEPAQINDAELQEIKGLEKSLGKMLVALAKRTEYADLDEQQLMLLKKTEEKLGCVVLAYADSIAS